MKGTTTGRVMRRQIECSESVFTIMEARRALPYVARVLRDAAAAYRLAQQARGDLETGASASNAALTRQRDEAIARLNRTIDECNAVGLAMLDIPRGRMALRATYCGRPVSLIWRLGESIDLAWKDVGEQASLAAHAARNG